MDIRKYALSGLEMKYLNPDAKLLKYTDLYKYRTIEEVFGNYKKVIILYLIQSNTSGHWTCLFKNKKGINFFDSYGVPVDYEMELLSPAKRKRLNQEQDYLNNMLRHERVIFNNITYQDRDTATCGCFVSHRLYYSHLDNYQYLDLFFKSEQDPDDLVSVWCFKRLGKI
jgi:hypothetical protein